MSRASANFFNRLGIELDTFQKEALEVIDRDHSLLVTAPTGSGKTLIATYAVNRAHEDGKKSFYTTPLKALSNQKYQELCAIYGSASVGLLTGDHVIGPDAPIVVMTTEVLRNMLLSSSTRIANLGVVVMDEVHFLQDPYRGGVWEEILILTPTHVQFVCLSATIGNGAELRDWLSFVRGTTELVQESVRPITLQHHLIVGHKRGVRLGVPSAADKSKDHYSDVSLIRLLQDKKITAEAARIAELTNRAGAARPRDYRAPRAKSQGNQMPFRTPRRSEIIEVLRTEDLLPAIVFIFSRAACDDAVRQCIQDGIRLTTSTQRVRIRAIGEDITETLSDDELRVLGYGPWLDALESGIASHHAGLVPAFRMAVEKCFVENLLPVVFATETLSLGINMPARTVVLEQFAKYGSAGRSRLTPGEYLQLTGRAGRRGLDEKGHAVVAWSREISVTDMAKVAVLPPAVLRSSFRTTYNFAVNLVSHFDRETSLEILQKSFAYWRLGTGEKSVIVEQFANRIAVLEELGFIDGWHTTPGGKGLARIYHDADILIARAVFLNLLSDLEPAVLAGVLSSWVYERRTKRVESKFGRASRRKYERGQKVQGERTRAMSKPTSTPLDRGYKEGDTGGKSVSSDLLGAKRREEITQRIGRIDELAEEIRSIEEIHHLPRIRSFDGALAFAVASWVRGATLGLALSLGEESVGELAAGDFVRILRQVADIAGQIAQVSQDPRTIAAAGDALSLIQRGVAASELSFETSPEDPSIVPGTGLEGSAVSIGAEP